MAAMVRPLDALLLDMREWGVMLREDAERRYGERTVHELLEGQFVGLLASPFGPVLQLEVAGRRRVGFRGPYDQPVLTAALDQLALRDARAHFEAETYAQFVPRLPGKHLFTLARTRANGMHRRSYAVAARYTSYDARSVRALYKRLFADVGTPLLNGLYVFVPSEAAEQLAEAVRPKQESRSFLLPHRILRVYSLPRSRPEIEEAGVEDS